MIQELEIIRNEILIYIAYKEGLLPQTDYLDYIKSQIQTITSGASVEILMKPKTGHWIRELIRNEKGGCIGAKMICSECGNDNKHDEYMNYCPNCGIKMVDSQEK